MNFKKRITNSKYRFILKPLWRFVQTIYKIPSILFLYKFEKIIHVYVDYKIMPYDYSVWVMFQNLKFELIKRKCKKFDLIIIDDKNQPRRTDQDFMDSNFASMVIQNIILDGLPALDGLRNVHYFKNRGNAFSFYLRNILKFKFPPSYNLLVPQTEEVHYCKYTQNKILDNGIQDIEHQKSDNVTLSLVKKWFKMKKIDQFRTITITIRNTHVEYRNSNIKEWASASNYLSEKYNLNIVLIPDYYDIYNDSNYNDFNKKTVICNEAAANVRFRIALYNLSLIDLSVESGPSIFSLYIDKPMIIFKKIKDKKANDIMNRINYGESWAHFKNYQKVIWEEDTKENIIKEVESMLKNINFK